MGVTSAGECQSCLILGLRYQSTGNYMQDETRDYEMLEMLCLPSPRGTCQKSNGR
jgi:hypothetical protein